LHAQDARDFDDKAISRWIAALYARMPDVDLVQRYQFQPASSLIRLKRQTVMRPTGRPAGYWGRVV